MEIAYPKNQVRFNLIFGIIWLIFSSSRLIFSENKFNYGLLWWVVVAAYFGMYFYQKKYPYILLKEDWLEVNGPLGKKMRLSEIKTIHYFAGEYQLTDAEKTIKISVENLDAKSKEIIQNTFDSISLESYKA